MSRKASLRCDGCGCDLNFHPAFHWDGNLLCESCSKELMSDEELLEQEDEARTIQLSDLQDNDPVDQHSDLDQNNPVDCSADTWRELYGRNPDLMDYDQEP